MKFKPFALTLPLLAAALASCGGGSSSPSKEIVVPFWTTFGQKNAEALQKKANEFASIMEKQQNVKVRIDITYQGSYDDMLNKVTNGFSAGNVPTMAIAYPDHVANYLANEPKAGDYVYNVAPYMEDAEIGFGKQSYLGDAKGKDDFVEAFIDEGNHYIHQGTYSMPFMKSSEVMFYNFDAAKRAMATYKPEIANSDDKIKEFIGSLTWDEFLKFGEHCLANKSTVLDTMKQPIWYDSDSNLFISKLFQEKIGYCSINNLNKGQIDFESGENRTKAEAFVTSLVEARSKGLLTTKGVEGTYGSDSFKAGESLFEIGSSGGTGYAMPEGAAFEVAVAKVPVSNNNPSYVSQGPTVAFLKNPSLSKEANDERAKYGWQFYKYITNPDSNVYLCIYGSEGYLPVRYSAYDTPEFAEFLENGEIYAETAQVLINDINGNYFNSAVFKGSAELRDQCGGIVTAALRGTGGTVTQIFDEAITQAKKGF